VLAVVRETGQVRVWDLGWRVVFLIAFGHAVKGHLVLSCVVVVLYLDRAFLRWNLHRF
jgi:hypothetical protein